MADVIIFGATSTPFGGLLQGGTDIRRPIRSYGAFDHPAGGSSK
jgi:hypothetical protein